MSGSRSKKSGGKYDDPKAGKDDKVRRKPEDVPLGTGMADKAKKDIKEGMQKRFPDPDKYK